MAIAFALTVLVLVCAGVAYMGYSWSQANIRAEEADHAYRLARESEWDAVVRYQRDNMNRLIFQECVQKYVTGEQWAEIFEAYERRKMHHLGL